MVQKYIKGKLKAATYNTKKRPVPGPVPKMTGKVTQAMINKSKATKK